MCFCCHIFRLFSHVQTVCFQARRDSRVEDGCAIWSWWLTWAKLQLAAGTGCNWHHWHASDPSKHNSAVSVLIFESALHPHAWVTETTTQSVSGRSNGYLPAAARKRSWLKREVFAKIAVTYHVRAAILLPRVAWHSTFHTCGMWHVCSFFSCWHCVFYDHLYSTEFEKKQPAAKKQKEKLAHLGVGRAF